MTDTQRARLLELAARKRDEAELWRAVMTHFAHMPYGSVRCTKARNYAYEATNQARLLEDVAYAYKEVAGE